MARLYALGVALVLVAAASGSGAGSAAVERTASLPNPAAALPLALGNDHTCAATTSLGVKCWGVDNFGQLGNGVYGGLGQVFSPQTVSGISSGVRALGAGTADTCALTSGGADVCWGWNNIYGQLGNGKTTPSNIPVTVTGLGSGVTAVAASGAAAYQSCAVVANGGAVDCWGASPLGDGTTNGSDVPVKVVGLPTGLVAVSTGGSGTSCALTSAGAVWCWGTNQIGEIGDNTTKLRLTAVPVPALGSGVVAIASGTSFSCALTSAGAVLCWGDNSRGQLGDGVANGPSLCLGGVRPCSLAPVAVSGLGSGVVAITAKGGHACALTNAGAVRCWGDNSSGELGNGGLGTKCFGPSPNGVCSDVPVGVSGLSSGVVVIAAGEHDTCARLDTGGVDCWGDNANGELGDGTTTERLTPVAVVGLTQKLTAAKSGGGAGLVTSAPAGISCGSACLYEFDAGGTITLTAGASIGSTFAGWSGACTGSGSTCTVTLSAARSVTASFALGPAHQRSDFNGDGRADLAVFRPSTGFFYVQGVGSFALGQSGDVPVPADYNGDGKADPAVWRPSTGTWLISGQAPVQYGGSGDIPVPADYNGDGKADIAVWRPSTGTFYVKGIGAFALGQSGDVPVPADYNGDGRADPAVWRPSTGTWYINGQASVQYGGSGDVPVPADYNGDGKADIAVFRPSAGFFYVQGVGSFALGQSGDVPVVADYNGDRKADPAVWRPSTGYWFVFGQTAVRYGGTGDIAL